LDEVEMMMSGNNTFSQKKMLDWYWSRKSM